MQNGSAICPKIKSYEMLRKEMIGGFTVIFPRHETTNRRCFKTIYKIIQGLDQGLVPNSL